MWNDASAAGIHSIVIPISTHQQRLKITRLSAAAATFRKLH